MYYMNSQNYIPTGRTSLVKQGEVALQVQTEYARRPAPRITTTVLNSGQVIHKIERSLNHQVESSEEKTRVEVYIKKQHSEIIAIIENNPLKTDPALSTSGIKIIDDNPESDQKHSEIESMLKESEAPKEKSTHELLAELPGEHRVFRLDSNGNMPDTSLSPKFKKQFKPVLKNLHTLLDLFAKLPAPGPRRKSGIYEIECNVLYLISDGNEFYLFYIIRPELRVHYEQYLRSVLKKNN